MSEAIAVPRKVLEDLLKRVESLEKSVEKLDADLKAVRKGRT